MYIYIYMYPQSIMPYLNSCSRSMVCIYIYIHIYVPTKYNALLKWMFKKHGVMLWRGFG